MTTPDPETGEVFDTDQMVDQVAIFFLAGHETSASALAWALYLAGTLSLSGRTGSQQEAIREINPEKIYFSVMSKLRVSRDVFRETLRLYPPVPMMVRENTVSLSNFRDRDVASGKSDRSEPLAFAST